MDTLKLKVPVVSGAQESDDISQTITVKQVAKAHNQPVRIGELMKGMENISSHPRRNEILKSIFSGIRFDPYA